MLRTPKKEIAEKAWKEFNSNKKYDILRPYVSEADFEPENINQFHRYDECGYREGTSHRIDFRLTLKGDVSIEYRQEYHRDSCTIISWTDDADHKPSEVLSENGRFWIESTWKIECLISNIYAGKDAAAAVLRAMLEANAEFPYLFPAVKATADHGDLPEDTGELLDFLATEYVKTPPFEDGKVCGTTYVNQRAGYYMRDRMLARGIVQAKEIGASANDLKILNAEYAQVDCGPCGAALGNTLRKRVQRKK